MRNKSSIVTSAADGCGNPSSIRSMDNSPSRDHKGADYKESFMFSNRSSVSRGNTLAATALAVAGLAMLSAGIASASVIVGVNFTTQSDTLSPTDTAGVVAQENFNNIALPTSTPLGAALVFTAADSNLLDSSGNTSGIGLTATFGNNYFSSTSTTTPNGILLDDIFKTGPTAPGTGSVTLSNIPAGDYNLLVYTTNDMSGQNGNYTVGNTTFYITDQQGSAYNGNFVQATNTNPSGTPDVGNYIEFMDISPTSGTINLTVAGANGGNAGVAGLQLESVPEPATLGLVMTGGLGLLLLRRRRA